ncbi:hypothetical protein SB6424_00003 [Klebsiella pasteurii]|nr:hypothetical protein SB6417_00003 [Klebsiella pasteurii]VUS54973.1 hypothetical protein SB6424_00003 [Klebsiella pasteurii]
MSVNTETASTHGQTAVLEKEGVYASLFEKINLTLASRLGDINNFLDDAALSDAPAGERLTAAMQVFMDCIRKSGQPVEKLDKTLIDHHIAELDYLISRQLDAVMHHEAFQKVESQWRGLNAVVQPDRSGGRAAAAAVRTAAQSARGFGAAEPDGTTPAATDCPLCRVETNKIGGITPGSHPPLYFFLQIIYEKHPGYPFCGQNGPRNTRNRRGLSRQFLISHPRSGLSNNHVIHWLPNCKRHWRLTYRPAPGNRNDKTQRWRHNRSSRLPQGQQTPR